MSASTTAKILPLLCVTSLIGVFSYLPSRTQARSPQNVPAPAAAASENPATPPPDLSDIPELALNDLIKRPAGPLGLELSDDVKSLEGKRIKVTGFMVHTDWADPSTFILANYPSNISEREFGPSDDLPPVQLFVKLPESMKTGFQRGVLQLAGTLRLGSAEEPYDRRSFLRLEIDPELKNWHATPKLVSSWSEPVRRQYEALSKLQGRISCTNCAVPTTAAQVADFVSPTTTINTRKHQP